MARVFRIWFVWGFWTTVLPSFMYLILLAFSQFTKLERTSTIAMRVLCGLMTTGIVAWAVVGALWRFSRPG